jgi:uncharacterized membrane protein
MSENPENIAPPPPPADPPPPPAGGPPPAAPAGGSNTTLMNVLAYLWILALVPLLVEKDDKEVQWHAKHGLVLLVAEIVLWIVINIVANVVPFLGCAIAPFVSLIFLVVRIICIVKAVNGERFIVPGLSQYADRF